VRYDIRSRVKALTIFSVLVLSLYGLTIWADDNDVAEQPVSLTHERQPISGLSVSGASTTTVQPVITWAVTTTIAPKVVPIGELLEVPPDCVVFSEIPEGWEHPLPDWPDHWGDINNYPECPPDNHTAEFYDDEFDHTHRTESEAVPEEWKDSEYIGGFVEEVMLELLHEILQNEYTFFRFDEDVKILQDYLDVDVDGIYGPITRGEHIKALVRLGQWKPVEMTFSLDEIVGDGGYAYPMDPEKRCPEWEETFVAYGLVPVDVWSYVAWKESRCRATVVNDTLNSDGSIDYGLVQINSIHRKAVFRVCEGWDLESMLLDVDCNLRMARYLMDNTRNRLGNWRIYMY
jgi:hypothetical protein